MSGGRDVRMKPGIRHAASALVSTTVGALPVFLFGGLAPLIREDLGFDPEWIGIGVAIYFGASALTSVHGGRLGERLGSQHALWTGIGISAAVLLGIATLARNQLVLAILLACGGIANAIIQPAANLALARGVDRSRQGFAFGVKQSAIPTATALGGFAVPVVGVTLGWRAAYLAAAVLALFAAILPIKDDVPDRPAGQPRPGMGRVPRSLYLLSLGIGLASAASNSLGAYLVEAMTSGGWDPATAGTVFGLASLLGIVTRLLVGWVSDRMDAGWLRLVAGMMFAGAGGYAALAFLEVPIALGLGVVLAFAGGWGFNGLFLFAIVRLHPEAPAGATGVTQAGATAGAVIGPTVFGQIAAATSYSLAWAFAAVLCAVGGAAMIAGRRRVFTERAA